jgi:hypothetical protein
VFTQPGSGFPSPTQVDTKMRKLLCLPTDIISVQPAL